MQYLKEATTATIVVGPFVDENDGKTAETAYDMTTGTIRVSKNGGAFAAIDKVGSSGIHMENGYYSIQLGSTDTGTCGRLTVSVPASGTALPVFREYMVIKAHVFDTFCSTDTFNVNVVEYNSVAHSTSAVMMGVNLVNIAGAAVSTGAGQLGVNMYECGGTAVTGRDIGASVLLSPGTGTGQLSISSGRVYISTGTSSGQIDIVGGQVKISTGTGGGQLDTTGGCVKISSGTGAGQLKIDSGAVIISTGTGTGQLDTTGGLVKISSGTGAGQIALDAGKVYISTGTGAGQLKINSGIVDANVAQISSSATAADTLEVVMTAGVDSSGYHKLSTGTGQGQVSLTSGIIDVNVKQISSSATAADNLELFCGQLGSSGEFTSGTFTTGAREFLWANTGAGSGIANDVMLERMYRFFFNKMNITDVNGAIALRNEADSADISTGTITDNDTTTVRSKLTWL